MPNKYKETLPWVRVLSESESSRTLIAYAFGPLVKLVEKTAGHVQMRVRYYDHKSNHYKTESALIAHMDYLARKGH